MTGAGAVETADGRTQVHTCGRRQRVAPDRSEPILAAGARGTATREAGARFARVLQRR